MKVLQRGGNLLTYLPIKPNGQLLTPTFDVQLGLQPERQERRTTKSSSDDDNDFLSKDIINLLATKGLMNDVQMVVSSLYNQSRIAAANPAMAERLQLQMISKLNQVVNNKAILENAVKQATDNDGFNEYAITTSGQLIVMDAKGKINLITPKQYKENLGKYKPLTNNELSQIRQTDPRFAFNTGVSLIIGNGVGPNKINEYITGIISKIGKEKYTTEGYVNKTQSKIAEGLQALIEGGPNGVYKVSTSGENYKDEKQELALNYILLMLPLNMSTYLDIKSAETGMSKPELVYRLIKTMSEGEETMKVDYETSINKDNTDKSGSNGADIKLNQAMNVMNMNGQLRPVVLNTGTNHKMTITAYHFGSPQRVKDDSPVSESTRLSTLLTDTYWGELVDTGSIYFGDLKINESLFDHVVYDNSDGFYTALLPFKLENNKEVIDLDALSRIAEANKEVDARGNAPEQEKKEIYKKHGVERFYGIKEDPRSVVKTGLLRPFIVFTGIATDDEKIITTDNKYINVLKGEQKDTYKKILLNAINRDVGKDENRSEYDFGWSFWPFVKDDIATGSVFMRINPNYSDVYTQAGQFFTPRVGYDEILSRARSAIDSYTNPIHSDASLLD